MHKVKYYDAGWFVRMSEVGRRSLLIAAIALCGAGRLAAQEELGAAATVKIDDVAGQVISSGRSAGIALAIAHDGRILFAKGYGYANLEDGAKVETDTVFHPPNLRIRSPWR